MRTTWQSTEWYNFDYMELKQLPSNLGSDNKNINNGFLTHITEIQGEIRYKIHSTYEITSKIWSLVLKCATKPKHK